MNSMAHLTSADQNQIPHLAHIIVTRLQLGECLRVTSCDELPVTIHDRLEIIGALYSTGGFCEYVEPFVKDDARITAFEDALTTQILQIACGQEASHV